MSNVIMCHVVMTDVYFARSLRGAPDVEQRLSEHGLGELRRGPGISCIPRRFSRNAMAINSWLPGKFFPGGRSTEGSLDEVSVLSPF